MRNDDHLIFENYFKKLSEGKASPSNFSGQPVKPVGSFANAPIPRGYDAMQNMINKKLAAKKGKSEDAEDHCHAAEIEHCKCNGCPECIANQSESEDAEGLPDSIEAKRKERKNIGSVRTKSEDAEDYDWNDREESDYDHGSRRYRGNGRYTDYRTGASHRDDQGPDDEDAETLSINQAEWGNDYVEVNKAINAVLHSELIPPHALKAILDDAESLGYTGEGIGGVDDVMAKLNAIVPALAKAIVSFNEKGVQDS